MKKIWILPVAFLMVFQSCSGQFKKKEANGLEMAVKMADSEIKQFPEPWTVDFNPQPVWNYTQV